MSYAPTLGRFIQRDPLGYVDGGSLYEYVRARSTMAVDPAGTWTILFDEAERRRGTGWSFLLPDSGHHCWAVCTLTVLNPKAGLCGAAWGNILELIPGMTAPDWAEDIVGNTFGYGAGLAVLHNLTNGPALAWPRTCDQACGTTPR